MRGQTSFEGSSREQTIPIDEVRVDSRAADHEKGANEQEEAVQSSRRGLLAKQ